MSKIPNSKQPQAGEFETFELLAFEFVSDFEFRISGFEMI